MINKELQKQIEQEAKTGQHTYPGTDYGHGFNKGYDSGYKFAGEKYAEKWQAEVVERSEARKLLDEVMRKHEAGLLPDRFVYEKIKAFLTPKTGSDE